MVNPSRRDTAAERRVFMALLLRSPDAGDGWRQISEALLPLVMSAKDDMPELLELDVDALRVRLTEAGALATKYLV